MALSTIALILKIKPNKIISGCSLYLKSNFFLNKIEFLRGGGKKRKKKNYTKPKKIKKPKKKVKMKVLSYYSVKNKNISKLRKESPESPGCFMANHFNRLTCGKTGLTFLKS
mmetsp:Transcript_12409/g.28565  ORF Transcript_12409/g.28565 Transcript_12409/m.28565 type:complete len:112 (-) Transcript_12409:197-532(-)